MIAEFTSLSTYVYIKIFVYNVALYNVTLLFENETNVFTCLLPTEGAGAECRWGSCAPL